MRTRAAGGTLQIPRAGVVRETKQHATSTGESSMKSDSKPGLVSLLGETRIFGEVTSFALYGLFHRMLPNLRRHRRGVLLIPGFGAGDLSLSPLGSRLRELDQQIFYSRLWGNVDWPVGIASRLR